MKKIGLAEMKEIENKILVEIASYCDEHRLKYFLGAGTLLGAIRHKGFIPWDDDIDIMMPREDYEKFLEEFNNTERKNSYIKVLSYKNTKDYYLAFAKVVDTRTHLREIYRNEVKDMGVFVDVFPIDNFPDSPKEEKKVFKMKHIYNKFYPYMSGERKYSNKKRSIKNRVVNGVLGVVMPKRWPGRKMDEILLKYNEVPTKRITYFTGLYGEKEIFDREVYEGKEQFAEFEGKKYPIPSDYDTYLTQLYGDYMELPPEEKRVCKHHVRVYWR